MLLPEQSVSWSEECLQAALLHELAHVQRWDWATQVTARLVCALYWWHPIVWFAAKQARAESERACDDLVLGTGVKAADYAQRLVEVVRSMPAGSQSRSVAIAMAQPSEVEGRLRAVLAKGCSRRPLTRRQTMGSFVVVMLLTLPLAAFCLTPSVQAHGTVPANTARNAAADRIIVANGHVAVVDGDHALFPGGYEVSLVGVTQAVRTGDEWDMFAGPWWRPDGTSIAPQSGGLNGHWHWSVAHTRGLAPYVFKVVFHTPRSAWKQGKSCAGGFFQQFLGARLPAENATDEHVVTNGLHPRNRYFTSPLIDGSAPQRFGGAVGGTRCAELYPIGTRACTVRFGVAAGPWRTAATHPFALTPASVTPDLSQSARYRTDVSLSLDEHPRETYLDAQGKPRVFYFLGSKAVLPNVARRFVAVDAAGHSVPLSEFGEQKVALAFGHSDVTKWNSHVDLSKIKEFRLQTCPYKTVEFRNIQLQPALAANGSQEASVTLLARAGTHQLEQARQLRAHLWPWAQNNKALLQKMAQAQPSDLTALMQVYTSLQHLPFPLWSGDPRMGQGSEDAPFANDLPSHLTLTHLQRSQDFTETRVKRDFLQLHDLAMAQSVNAGRSHVTIWASGRITQTMETDKFMRHGQPIGTVESQQEIVPSFSRDQKLNGISQALPSIQTAAQGNNPAALTFKDHPIVVVDPGHGGQDAGAIGASGVTEKALNLQIAQQLRTELERRGAVVYLTRDGDTSLPIMGRSQFGVECHADYFISLHCDLWPQRTSATPQRQDTEGQGTLAYYHGQDPNAPRLAENISLKIGQVSASFPNRTLSDRVRFPTGFGVLRSASMPAVLIECGYMDNVHDLKRLRDPQGQQQIADGIAEGLVTFRGRG